MRQHAGEWICTLSEWRNHCLHLYKLHGSNCTCSSAKLHSTRRCHAVICGEKKKKNGRWRGWTWLLTVHTVSTGTNSTAAARQQGTLNPNFDAEDAVAHDPLRESSFHNKCLYNHTNGPTLLQLQGHRPSTSFWSVVLKSVCPHLRQKCCCLLEV